MYYIFIQLLQLTFLMLLRAEKKIKHCRIKLEGRLYTIGVKQFESLVELIKYYEQNYLYKKIKLWFPVNDEIVQRLGTVSIVILYLLSVMPNF